MAADSALLSVFPAPLARLLLCGGGGLPAMTGPLLAAPRPGVDLETVQIDWCPQRYDTYRVVTEICRTFQRFEDAIRFLVERGVAIPLDDGSPWPARLALAAAWMLGHRAISAAWWDDVPHAVTLHVASAWRFYRLVWSTDDGEGGRPALPTLPTHLAQHPPCVAFLLALYDVPEIRTRVEGAL